MSAKLKVSQDNEAKLSKKMGVLLENNIELRRSQQRFNENSKTVTSFTEPQSRHVERSPYAATPSRGMATPSRTYADQSKTFQDSELG